MNPKKHYRATDQDLQMLQQAIELMQGDDQIIPSSAIRAAREEVGASTSTLAILIANTGAWALHGQLSSAFDLTADEMHETNGSAAAISSLQLAIDECQKDRWWVAKQRCNNWMTDWWNDWPN